MRSRSALRRQDQLHQRNRAEAYFTAGFCNQVCPKGVKGQVFESESREEEADCDMESGVRCGWLPASGQYEEKFQGSGEVYGSRIGEKVCCEETESPEEILCQDSCL